MSLTNRLSLYFLTALATVLLGFSFTLYFIARSHLYGQLDERLHHAMKTLVAAVEVHPNDVQWEPLERRITMGEEVGADQPRWSLRNFQGRLIDQSFNLSNALAKPTDVDQYCWFVLTRRMRASVFTPELLDGKDDTERKGSLSAPFKANSTVELQHDRTYLGEGLDIFVAVSEAPVVQALHWLAWVLAGISITIWGVAACWGRWLCQRALLPVSHMAFSARSIRKEPEATQVVDVPGTKDELEDLGNAFNELLHDLRQSLERQRRFTGDASHQLRTPLTAMLASVEVALRHDRSSQEYQRVLQTVVRRGGQLRGIIESLLFLARGDGATLLGSPELIDLNQWCETYLEAWTEHARSTDITFQSTTSPVQARTFPGLLGQILDNLLDNACKYSEPGTPIRVCVDSTPTHVSISVCDSGCGIADDQQLLIFEPFYRSTESRWQGKSGVGLGLAVVNQLTKLLGAQIEVVSKVGEGSLFRIVLLVSNTDMQQQCARTAENAMTVQV